MPERAKATAPELPAGGAHPLRNHPTETVLPSSPSVIAVHTFPAVRRPPNSPCSSPFPHSRNPQAAGRRPTRSTAAAALSRPSVSVVVVGVFTLMGPAPRDVLVISSDDEQEEEEESFGESVFLRGTLGWIAWIGDLLEQVPQQNKKSNSGGVRVGKDDDDEEEGSGQWAVSRGPLGWVAKLGESPVPVPRKQRKGKDPDDDDCVILDGDPDRPAAVAGAKGKSAVGGASDEVEIVALKGEIACKDFPHSRHLCSELPFSTTSHVKHCSMCYCFVCDAPAPCKYWGKGLLNDDHCHATDNETKWRTLRQAFKCKSVPASHPDKHPDVVFPTTPSPRQQAYHEEHTPEQYFDPDEEARVRVGNLSFAIDSKDLAQFFKYAGTVTFSEIIYGRETGQSYGYGFVTMSTGQEAERAVKTFHHCVLGGKPMTVNKAAATSGARAEERPSPCRSESSSFKLYVSNLPWEVDGPTLRQLFSGYGEVVAAKVLYHRRGAQRRSRGFGFVTMATPEGLQDAIWHLDKLVWKGRKLRVQVAREDGTR